MKRDFYSLRICSFFCLIITFVFVSFIESTAIGSQCSSQKPSVCSVLPPEGSNGDTTHVLGLLKNSFVSITGNMTVYAGQTARFIIELDKSIVSDVSPVAYVDGCSDSAQTNCQLIEDNVQMKSIRECVFRNVTQSDNGKEIVFYALSFSLLTQLCYNPPSYLHVLSLPDMPVVIHYSVDSCTGIHFEVTSPVEPDTAIQYSVYYVSPDGLSANLITTFITNNITGVISPNFLHNHTGIYKIVTSPVNPAGAGPSTSATISLPGDNYSLNFTVEDLMMKASHNSNQFKAVLMVKINQKCPLTVPNNLFISSSCSNYGKGNQHSVNMVWLLGNQDITDDDQLAVSYPALQAGKHNCTFIVQDDTGHKLSINTKTGTFHTASYQLYTNSLCVYVQCTFTPGTMAEGCMIVVYNEQGDIVDNILYPHTNQSSSTDYAQLGPFSPGQYSLYIYDYIDGREFNQSTVPAFEEGFFIQAIVNATASDIVTSNIPSGTPCFDDDCHKILFHENSIYEYIIGCGAMILFLIAVVLGTIVSISSFVCSRKLKKQSFKSNEQESIDNSEPDAKSSRLSLLSISSTSSNKELIS